MAMHVREPLQFPLDIHFPIDLRFIHEAWDAYRAVEVGLLTFEQLSPHDRVVLLRFGNRMEIYRQGGLFRGVANCEELLLIEDIYMGLAVHTQTPNFVI